MNDVIVLDTTPAGLKQTLFVKVPGVMYQAYFDMALQKTHNVRTKIFEDVNNWVIENYPGYGLLTFEDFSTEQAKAFNEKTGLNITWGMWLMLDYGVKSSLFTNQSSIKLLNNVQQSITLSGEEKENSGQIGQTP